ncbi:MAG: ABC transporter permease [Gemmataceae bacterium]
MNSIFIALGLALLQGLAALPWLIAIDPQQAGAAIRRPSVWLGFVGGVLLGAVGLFALMQFRNDPSKLEFDGQVYASILHLQLGIDAIITVLAVLLWLWPKGGTVALAAFREGYRQPMFWLIIGGVIILLVISVFIPYFSFGDDFKMMKQLSFDMIKLSTLLFAVLAASISISEEIEGRTAVTLMSKPVTRRQFLLGKFFGILLAAAAMTVLLSWVQNWMIYWKPFQVRLEDTIDPLSNAVQAKIVPAMQHFGPLQLDLGPEGTGFIKGIGLWLGESLANLCGLALGFGQVMIMLAIAASLATRLPMIVSLNVCLIFYLLGNLAPILARESEQLSQKSGGALTLVAFLAQLMDKVLPSFNFFSTDQVFMRETYLQPSRFAVYVASAGLYAVIYTVMSLFAGLFLIEDRDLA